MGYCTRTDIEYVIAQALTSATASTPDALNSTASLLNIGNTLDKNLVSYNTIDSYIRIADSQINGTLSELYKTPLMEKVDLEMSLYSDITEYNDYIVLDKVYPLSPGDMIIIYQEEQEERHIINEAISSTVFSTIEFIQYYFESGARVVRISYPDPVRWISARYAAANIYDKYFSAQVSPSISNFGENLRGIARDDLNNILIGTIILQGQERIGRRFYNPNLVDQYALPKGGALPREMREIKK